MRKIAVAEIPIILRQKPQTLGPIYKAIRKEHPENCDDSIICACGNRETQRSEWKHQVRWALQDLRYSKKINYSRKTREYSMK